MSPFRKTAALILFAFLSFNAKLILADSPQETHANPNLIHQGSYGPVQKNDTLWSIAKLLKKENESINDVIVELTLTNPNSIKPGKKLFVGQYIHRHSAPEKAQNTAHNIEIAEQPITTVSETQESSSPIDSTQEQSEPPTLINTDVELVTTNEKPIEASTIVLTVLTIIILGLFFGLPIIKRKRQQQKIDQDEINKTNALKRELIKNRLKTTSVIELS